jgi:hypothetical protein
MKNKTPQRQFRNGYVPQEHVMPHSMDNREAGSPSGMRARDSLALGNQTAARPGLSGIQSRSKLSKPKRTSRGR